jgi:hypothetical protein
MVNGVISTRTVDLLMVWRGSGETGGGDWMLISGSPCAVLQQKWLSTLNADVDIKRKTSPAHAGFPVKT